MKHSEKAKELFNNGYNCSQSVLCAFLDELDIDEETALKLSSSFGGGMGRLREVCGAVSAMFMIAGLKNGYTSSDDDSVKEAHYTRIQELAKTFEDKFGSIICRDLLELDVKHDSPVPSPRTEQYYAERPCEYFVSYAAEVLDEYFGF